MKPARSLAEGDSSLLLAYDLGEAGQNQPTTSIAEDAMLDNIKLERFFRNEPKAEQTLTDDRSEVGGSLQQTPVNYSPLLIMPKASRQKESFIALQRWEGIVEEVGDDSFFARLIDMGGHVPVSRAEILLEEVDPEDRVLMEPGAVFYWTIGYAERPSGRQRSSVIRFRRLPVWKPKDLALAERRAAEILAILCDEPAK